MCHWIVLTVAIASTPTSAVHCWHEYMKSETAECHKHYLRPRGGLGRAQDEGWVGSAGTAAAKSAACISSEPNDEHPQEVVL